MSRNCSRLFGWKIEETPGMEYWLIQTVPIDGKGIRARLGVNGGRIKKQNSRHVPVNYIAAESVDEHSKKIESPGGKIIVPKTEVPGVG